MDSLELEELFADVARKGHTAVSTDAVYNKNKKPTVSDHCLCVNCKYVRQFHVDTSQKRRVKDNVQRMHEEAERTNFAE